MTAELQYIIDKGEAFIQATFIIALMITGIYMSFQEGMIFNRVRANAATLLDWMVGKRKSKYAQKPLWDCLICMSGIWTMILCWEFNPYVILTVAGWMTIIDKVFFADER